MLTYMICKSFFFKYNVLAIQLLLPSLLYTILAKNRSTWLLLIFCSIVVTVIAQDHDDYEYALLIIIMGFFFVR